MNDLKALNKKELTEIIRGGLTAALIKEAVAKRQESYGTRVFVRGLIEFTNFCKNGCYYCGINCANKNVHRYRLTPEQITECCDMGYDLGFRTFVLQGGEDPGFSDEMMCRVVHGIKEKYPDCAVTLSCGEREKSVYKDFFDAGADRYLLRHETADDGHYARLHPQGMSLSVRKKCLYDLKEIGFQVGAGFMVGSPFQTDENLAEDLLFLKELSPHMVGIGPFIHHSQTPFRHFCDGTLGKTLLMVTLTRLMLPKALLPSTTALATIAPGGRERGILCGANVVMPNLSPAEVRSDYTLYENKVSFGAEAAENLKELSERMGKIGFTLDFSRGDHVDKQR